MTDTPPQLRFYHLEHGLAKDMLPKLLEKARRAGHKILITCASDEELDQLNTHLWGYTPESFLPHVNVDDKHAENTPICLATSVPDTVPNGADMLVLFNEAPLPKTLSGFKMVCHIFEATPTSLKHARAHWKQRQDSDVNCSYWKQDMNGKWQQAA